MSSGIYNIGISALQTAQIGLTTAWHNIANANTDGYNRQRVLQASSIANRTGVGYIGTGVRVTTVERIYDSFLSRQVSSAQTSVSALETYASMLSELNTLLADEDAGLESALEGFFTGISQVNADPSSRVTRQTLVSNAQSLVSRFKTLSNQLDEQYQSVNGQIRGYVDSINSYGQRIAKVNQQIMDAELLTGQQPNDLYDQRDQLLAELNKLIGVQTSTNSNGTLNVIFGNGQPLVVGMTATPLTTMVSSGNYGRMSVGIVNGGRAQELPESLISGGALSGILQYRSESLDTVANSLGQIAASIALTFNAQHALGQDLLGNIAGEAGFVADFFKLSNPTVVPSTNNPASTATVTAEFLPPSQNADGTFFTNLTTSDYRLRYDGTNYTLTRLSDNVSWSSSASIDDLNDVIENSAQGSQGFSLAESGSLASGSTYLIQPTRNAARDIAVNPSIAADVRQIAAAAPIFASAKAGNTGTAAISAGSVTPGYTAPPSGTPATLTYDEAASGFLPLPSSFTPAGGFNSFPAYPVTMTVDGEKITYASGPVPYTSGATYSFNGISFSISGSPGNGDVFNISRNSNAVSDNRNTLLLGQLQTGKAMIGNSANFSTVYAQMVSNAGNKGGEVNTVLAAQRTVLNEAEEARSSFSGVNLDEEAVNLILYQQSYQAAAKVLQIGSELFASILAIVS